MRIQFFKTMVETEVAFEQLTGQEQIELITKLIKDANMMHPEYKLDLIRTTWTDESLDW